ILIEQNNVCDHIYFIEKGLTRTYYLKNGKDVTDWLSPENSFACSILSFLTRTPDRRIIELLEPSTLFALHYNDLETLYSKYHDIENLGRHLVGFGLVQVQQRFDELHFTTAANRYKTLLKNNPDYIKRVPLGILASYLGMSQETLSRARAKK
ncbi:MAG: Crp/Fnr family transcriptional regulator, partial [Bacteroidetes bacterium]|nr:Crp/Fnr family transcriptional regulator [Bacteroidota bacterium]